MNQNWKVLGTTFAVTVIAVISAIKLNDYLQKNKKS